MKAAEKGDLKTLRKILNKLRSGDKLAELNFCAQNGFNALHIAI